MAGPVPRSDFMHGSLREFPPLPGPVFRLHLRPKEKYAPLGHLLDGSEFAFLEAQCGQNRSLVRRFRARRARIALEFLNEMRADFGRLQSIGMALVAAGRGTAGFEEELFRHRIRFTRNWWRVRSQVLLWQLGVGGVDVEGLLESMRISSSTVRAALQPAAYVS